MCINTFQNPHRATEYQCLMRIIQDLEYDNIARLSMQKRKHTNIYIAATLFIVQICNTIVS